MNGWSLANNNINIIVVISRSMGGLCNGKLGEKFNEVFSELMEGDLSKACRYPSVMMMMKGLKTLNIVCCRATHGITVEVPSLRTAYALPVPKQRSVFSYQLVFKVFHQVTLKMFNGCAR